MSKFIIHKRPNHILFFLFFWLLIALNLSISNPSVFARPPVSAPKLKFIQHVSPDGDDKDDGLSWQTAKQTILAAYDALQEDQGGTIYFASGSPIGKIGDQGLWILGPNDPKWSSPPQGWRRQKRLMLIGLPSTHVGNAPGMPQAWIRGGSETNSQKPTIWISGTNTPLHFENISIQYPAVAIRLGVSTDGRRDVSTSNISFHNVGAALHNIAGNGPTVDIGYVFWVWFTRCVFSANTVEPLSSDKRAAVLTKPIGRPPVPSTGLLTISDSNFNDGNFKYYAGDSSWSFLIRNCVFEGDFKNPLPPSIHILNANQYGNAYIESLHTADAPGTEADVKVEGSAPAESVVVVNVLPGIIVGKATVIGRYPANWQNVTSSPANNGQIGFWNGRVAGQHDSARRSFGPVAVRFPNLVNQEPLAWAKGFGKATVTPGILAPDGTNRAGRLSTTLSGRQERIIFSSYQKFSVGDFVIAGLWVRAASNNGFLVEAPGQINLSNSNFRFNNRMVLSAPLKGDGEWEWIGIYGKITQIDPNPSVNGMDNLIFSLYTDSIHPHDFYAPILLHIAAGSISDNEAVELANHLSSWPPGVSPGSVALLEGQQFVFPPDVNLHRSGPQTLKTDGKLIAELGLGVGNFRRSTELGSVVGQIEIFDDKGNSLGFLPVYKNRK